MQYSSIWDCEDDLYNNNEVCVPETAMHASRQSWDNVVIKRGSISPYRQTITNFQYHFGFDLLTGFVCCEFCRPYGIQSNAFMFMIKNDASIVIHAENNSGKTVAALMAILYAVERSRQERARPTSLQAVMICRTLESAERAFALLTKMAKHCSWMKFRLAIRGERVPPYVTEHVVIGTPDKILKLGLTELPLLVADQVEAGHSGRGYEARVIEISRKLQPSRVILLSAVPPSEAMMVFQNKVTNVDPITLEFPPEPVRYCRNQIFVICRSRNERLELVKLVVAEMKGQAIVICNTRDFCTDVTNCFREMDKSVIEVSGKIKIKKKLDAMKEAFRNGAHKVLVTTLNPEHHVISPNVHTVVSCDIMLTSHGTSLDHDTYRKRMSLLCNDRKGLLINVICEKWAEYANDQNGVKYRLVSFSDFAKSPRSYL